MHIKKLTAPSWIDEFKAFAFKGNVVDMAVGVVIGGAFGKIVSSLVADIITPLIASLTGGRQPFADLAFDLNGQAVKYGSFIQTVVDFLIIALCIFFAIRALCKLRIQKKEQDAPQTTPPPTPEEILLLREIRDSLKK